MLNLNEKFKKLGKPNKYRGANLIWSEGRLTEIENLVKYTYDESNNRISKTINNITTKFYISKNKLFIQDDGANLMYFLYEAEELVGFSLLIENCLPITFTYSRNEKGEIDGIFDASKTLICKYEYDIFGKCKCLVLEQNGEYVSESSIEEYMLVANVNPFRFKDFYYDYETGFYYVNGKFIDSENQTILN